MDSWAGRFYAQDALVRAVPTPSSVVCDSYGTGKSKERGRVTPFVLMETNWITHSTTMKPTLNRFDGVALENDCFRVNARLARTNGFTER